MFQRKPVPCKNEKIQEAACELKQSAFWKIQLAGTQPNDASYIFGTLHTIQDKEEPNDCLPIEPIKLLDNKEVDTLAVECEDAKYPYYDAKFIAHANALKTIRVISLDTDELKSDAQKTIKKRYEQPDTDPWAGQGLIETYQDAYVAKDLSVFAALEKSLDAETKHLLLTKRNQSWLEKIGPRQLIVVGAMHLLGDTSVLELLKQKGHQVCPLKYTFRFEAEREKTHIREKWLTWYDDSARDLAHREFIFIKKSIIDCLEKAKLNSFETLFRHQFNRPVSTLFAKMDTFKLFKFEHTITRYDKEVAQQQLISKYIMTFGAARQMSDLIRIKQELDLEKTPLLLDKKIPIHYRTDIDFLNCMEQIDIAITTGEIFHDKNPMATRAMTYFMAK